MNVPVLFTTYNRLEYTRQSLPALMASDCGLILVVDNNSTDGTKEYLQSIKSDRIHVIYEKENTGVAGAMNLFLQLTHGDKYVGKVDNDTIVPPDWCSRLLAKIIVHGVDIIQAKHPIPEATYSGGNFYAWMQTMKQDRKDPSLYYHRFVGGSGIVFKRKVVDRIPETEWKLYGWNTFQKEHPELKKAFCMEVEIELLDMYRNGGTRYADYPEYYKETRRIK